MTMPHVNNKYTEEEIVRKISYGDQLAFKKLFHLYFKKLCRFAFLFLYSKEMSEEVVLDVFLNIWIKREQLTSVHNIRLFLYASVRNKAINYSQREKPVHSRKNINVYELEIESGESSFEDSIDHKFFHERLQKSFDLLPERCKMIARLHFNDQLQYNEIAKILHISHKTVRAQIAIAIHKVKETFQKYGWDK